ERGDFVEVVGEGVVTPAQFHPALDGYHRGSFADDLRTEQLEEIAHLLHMRLTRRVHELRGALYRQRAEDEVLGRGHRRVFKPHPGRLAASGGTEHDLMPALT